MQTSETRTKYVSLEGLPSTLYHLELRSRMQPMISCRKMEMIKFNYSFIVGKIEKYRLHNLIVVIVIVIVIVILLP